MNKTAIKNFAINARIRLRNSVITMAETIGITEQGSTSAIETGAGYAVYKNSVGEKRLYGEEIRMREKIVKKVEEMGFDQMVEEVAYTWFNRIIAIRFMEVNDYLPGRVRVLSSETKDKIDPDIVTEAPDVDLNLSEKDCEFVYDCKMANTVEKMDALFRRLFIKQCNKLNEILPELFQPLADYSELLLNISYSNKDDVIRMLVDTIEEKDFDIHSIGDNGKPTGQVEIIGWLYQYYNTEPKAKVFGRPSSEKIKKEDIPAATQLFTPDWIVRYMVENSLGRLWVNHLEAVDQMNLNGDGARISGILKENWKYYLEEAEQEPEVLVELKKALVNYQDLKPEDIRVIDPCEGSGHILVYCFDVLMQIYQKEGYSPEKAVRSIIENNLYGMDIDERAFQLAYFAVMMKARSYDRRFFRRTDAEGNLDIPKPHIYAIKESNHVNRDHLQYLGAGLNPMEKNDALNQINGLLDDLYDAKEYGSILNIENYDWKLLHRFVKDTAVQGQLSFDTVGTEETQDSLTELIDVGQTLAQKYDVVVTNPPYMAISNGDAKLIKYVHKNYYEGKADFFAVFIQRCLQMTRVDGYAALITQHAWMFLSSFEKLRAYLSTYDITNMSHLGARAFDEISGEVVQTTSFVINNTHTAGYKGTYIRLVDGMSQKEKEDIFLSGKERYFSKEENYTKIPGNPIVYWTSKAMLDAFDNKILYDVARPRQGMATTNNDLFLRFWHEIRFDKMGLGCISQQNALDTGRKWFPVTKGGTFRRWYGNFDYVVNYENAGKTICDYIDNTPGVRVKSNGRVINRDLYFHEGMTWSTIASGLFGMRYVPNGFIFETKGSMCFTSKELLPYLLGLYNTPVIQCFLQMVSPTLDYHEGPLGKTPVIIKPNKKIDCLVERNIKLSQTDWDSFETSWDFSQHPLLAVIPHNRKIFGDINNIHLAKCYSCWKQECEERFNQLKANEEALNRIFIDIYGLQDELTPEVEDKDVTVRKADLQRDIKSLISYAVGCMFGRYSLDEPGLILAGQSFSEKFTYASVPVTGTGICGDPLSATYTKGNCYLRKEDGTVQQCTFEPDYDNIIPITDEEYFEDDIVGLFCAWVKKVYGEQTLEENLDFIAKALGNKGNTSREVIRNYFLNDFIKDHIKIYQKRPIYWLFDSGKQNGFKALIYMHRYNADTVGRVRTDYLHKTQNAIEIALKSETYRAENATKGADKSRAMKLVTKYQKQIEETRSYDAALGLLANQRIEIDLDDGVKVNYEKFQGVTVSTEGKKETKVNLLTKI